ncbi:GspH/FimT family pseudopilin [Teredinibacter turnerae]|uniref:GspH/FimT family pseudopilin n=1 Tax=Teredinibacter turnerae TaxID=2426 RepID=UPI000379E966|nr:GspH/FimT family pseudopilin [Teredinibacter turnerae]
MCSNHACQNYFYHTLPRCHQNGFTLANLLTSLAIIAIVCTFAIPGFDSLWKKNRLRLQQNELKRVLNYTRSQAINTGSTAIICPSNDDINCSGNWQQPLIIFSDINNNRSRDTNEPLLRKAILIQPGRETLAIRTSGSNNLLRYKATGETSGQNGRFFYCLGDTEEYRGQIIFLRTGRTRFAHESELQSGCG